MQHIKVGSESDALNLSKIINDGNWMVLYYAEWCGHCKTMKPEWNKVVKKFNNPKNNSNSINIAEVESNHIGNLLNKPEIAGFPTIQMYNSGKPVANFNEERVASKIIEFANNNSNSKSKVITNEKQKEQVNKNNIYQSIKEIIKEGMKNNAKKAKQAQEAQTQEAQTQEIQETEPYKLNPSTMEIKLNANNLTNKTNSVINAIDSIESNVPMESNVPIESMEPINTNQPNLPVQNEMKINNLILSNIQDQIEPQQSNQKKNSKKKNSKKKNSQKKNSQKKNSQKKNANANPNPIINKPPFKSNNLNVLNLPCDKIRRAKFCKSNPKCFYDGSDFKCKDRIFKTATGNFLNTKKKERTSTNNMVGNIIMTKPNTRKNKKGNNSKNIFKSGKINFTSPKSMDL